MESHKASEYRAIVARMNYLAADRPDIAFAVKEAAREISSPTNGGWDRLKRIGRYLSYRPRLVLEYNGKMCHHNAASTPMQIGPDANNQENQHPAAALYLVNIP